MIEAAARWQHFRSRFRQPNWANLDGDHFRPAHVRDGLEPERPGRHAVSQSCRWPRMAHNRRLRDPRLPRRDPAAAGKTDAALAVGFLVHRRDSWLRGAHHCRRLVLRCAAATGTARGPHPLKITPSMIEAATMTPEDFAVLIEALLVEADNDGMPVED